ncbi:MAG: hypothetical protein EOP50_16690 [Sphingobacteriales bacterium]|nr:MAG: hypothetical protein EOP50_16690 [Sphingobacteriales bacterium]
MPVAQGDSIEVGSEKLTVSWPPRHFDNRQLGYIAETVRAFEKFIERIEGLAELYSRLRNSQAISVYSAGESPELLVPEHSEPGRRKTRMPRLTPAQAGVVKVINERLKRAASCLSLAYFNDRLNFMGDLEAREIDQVVNYLVSKGATTSKVIVLPHHGTHWHQSMLNLSGTVGFSSCGSRMRKHWTSANNTICSSNQRTDISGDISQTL